MSAFPHFSIDMRSLPEFYFLNLGTFLCFWQPLRSGSPSWGCYAPGGVRRWELDVRTWIWLWPPFQAQWGRCHCSRSVGHALCFEFLDQILLFPRDLADPHGWQSVGPWMWKPGRGSHQGRSLILCLRKRMRSAPNWPLSLHPLWSPAAHKLQPPQHSCVAFLFEKNSCIIWRRQSVGAVSFFAIPVPSFVGLQGCHVQACGVLLTAWDLHSGRWIYVLLNKRCLGLQVNSDPSS